MSDNIRNYVTFKFLQVNLKHQPLIFIQKHGSENFEAKAKVPLELWKLCELASHGTNKIHAEWIMQI